MRVFKHFLFLSLLMVMIVGCSSNEGTIGEAEGKENFPEKAITTLVPFGAGGGMDTVARGISEVGTKYFDEPLVVVNREGASGTVAAQEAAKADPDGYTTFLVSGAILTVQPHMKKLNYTLDDFKMLTSVVYNPLILMAKADGPFKTLSDVIEAGESGEAISLGHPGVGTSNDISQKALFGSLGIEATHTPFQANSESLAAILGGHIDMAAVHPAEATSFIESGDLVPLGVFTSERYENMPDVPTIGEAAEEAGVDFKYKDHDFSSWYYMAVPKDTPDYAVKYLEDKFKQTIEDPDFSDYGEKLNMSIQVYSGEEMDKTLKELEETNKEIIEQLDAK